MNDKSAHQKHKKRREKLWMQDERCFFCGESTVLVRSGGNAKDTPENAATLFHLRNKFSPDRLKPSNNQERTVLTCKACAVEQSKISQSIQPLEELQKRSGNYPFSTSNVIKVWTLDDRNEGNKDLRRAVKQIIRKNWRALASVLDRLALEENS